MRQLRISKQPTDPYWAVDHAQTQPLLQRLTATHPLPLTTAAQEKLLRHLVAVARQCRERGATWAELLTAGYMAAVRCHASCANPARWGSWWVRQGILTLTYNCG